MQLCRLFLLALLFSVLLSTRFASQALAFPEMVRHRYTNCVACHVSPNGGGILTAYGRQTAKAALSTGKFFFEPSRKAEPQSSLDDDRDPETEFLYGAVAQPEWLNLGGDVRFLELYQNTPTFTQASFITMQVDLEAAVTLGKFTFVGTFGRDSPLDKGVPNPTFSDYLTSRRHYAIYQLTDEIHVMAGKFQHPYGIIHPYHFTVTKQGLGWNFGSESYNLQVGYVGETYNLTAYGDAGRFDSPKYYTFGAQVEKGGGLNLARIFGDSHKVGVSYFYGSTDLANRQVFGPWAILGFTEHFYLRTEHDFARTSAKNLATDSWSYQTTNRLGYEFFQGVHAYIDQEFQRKDLDLPFSQTDAYGVGFLYYPRVHWEFEVSYQKRRVGGSAASFQDYAYLYLHFYP